MSAEPNKSSFLWIPTFRALTGFKVQSMDEKTVAFGRKEID